ncbi:hypothetical protein M2459_002124 [Parabacteroides sp. PF5-5]|nr:MULTISPECIES: DUF5686 and carboxypeptidase regulatory-like domain-containing protein [unclassified Parabacteroides]MDH6306859.1 hypothetical protein [Parabacteroides sp. PH5-39]MDH6316305.1 hypothetical protein [Parabacteroides sp. PF5-13]MDH6319788.1 hypothetical protein [Parabacteroides sp. PH5-13]MDH6323621.1 hypothetical protein [Parabacteroides sp. PH5-8]MDH6327492.1 hypothetical protein [Parabacteroides sp. PH5-41]
MRISLLLLLFTFTANSFLLSEQTVRGQVMDSLGEAVPYASLFIQEIAQGIVCNDQGKFQTTLKEGNYTFEFGSLGYERKTIAVTVGKEPIQLTVAVEKKTYELKEVIVYPGKEDPAYAIMRKAISMAPFYLHQVKGYESEVYLKGTIKMEKIPRYMKIQAGGQQISGFQDKLFLIESQNEVKFTAPNTYEQHVIATNSNLPAEIDVADALDVITTNIYDPNALGKISPLSTQAFNYYNFKWEGITKEGNHSVNKIRVTPKKKNPKLMTGWLYIIESSWNVQSADLSSTEYGVTLRFTATYNEVKPYTFLPTSYDMDMKIDILGIKASGKYYSSVRYKDVELNETPTTPTPKQQKAQKQLDKLTNKEKLTNRDAYKMAKLMEKTIEPEELHQSRGSLELLPVNSNIKLTVDSMAKSRDSIYWEATRNLPLRNEEIESFKAIDSLNLNIDRNNNNIIVSTGIEGKSKLMGGRIPLGEKAYWGYNGLPGVVPEYNFVDGIWLGQRLTLGTNLHKRNHLSVSPSVYYVTARKTINWQIDGNFRYAPLRNGSLSVSGGNTSADFNNMGELRLINSLSSLFFAENPIKFYQKRFFEVINHIDVANGLMLTSSISIEHRNALENNLSWSIFNRTPDSNLPGRQVAPMPDNHTTKYAAHLEYTPRYYYRIQGGRKQYANSKYPTLGLGYVRAITNMNNLSPDYHRLDASIRQKIQLHAFDHLSYQVQGGVFLNGKHPTFFPDYKHFRTSELFLTGYSAENSFSLLDNYTYSTNDKWLEAHLSYSTAYLLIKHLSFLQNYIFKEYLHARTLWIPGKNHTEFGYSIGIQDIGNIGLFVSLEKGKYDGLGFTISIPILREMGAK